MKIGSRQHLRKIRERTKPAYPGDLLKNHLRLVTKPITVYKKVYVRCPERYSQRCSIVKLVIPVGARIVHHQGQREFDRWKMRTDLARVVSINDKSAKKGYAAREIRLPYQMGFTRLEYVPGNTVHPHLDFDTSRTVCASGIHFFLTEKEARRWKL